MIRLSILTLAAVLVAGCSPRTGSEPMRNGPARYLALGDSYTIGEGIEADERWPVQLTTLLRERGVEIGDPEIIARTGWTTDELSAAIDAADPAGPYDLVTLLIGVNDQYRGRPVADFRPQLEALVQRAIGFAGGAPERVVVLSIPDWGITPFAEGRDREAIAREIDDYNRAKREIVTALGARFVDVTPASRDGGSAAEMLASDGLHPSASMYARWAALALQAAAEALRGR